jgi:hypothetical protein
MRWDLCFVTMLFILGCASIPSSAVAQDSARIKQQRCDSIRAARRRAHVTTSKGDVLDTNVSQNLPKRDTAAIRPPSRQDTSKIRSEMRRDTSSVAADTAVRAKPPADPCAPG